MKKVQILMSTYNGEIYIKEQIDSLLNQQDVEISILVRDDGSTDSTKEILREYAKKEQLKYYIGKNKGYGKSFLDLLKNSDDVEYYAFCDQDDIWHPRKLITAINKLENEKNNDCNCGNLYFSNLRLVDSNMKEIKIKEFDKRNMLLGRNIVRHSISGATMVFDKKLRDLAKVQDFESYDYPISHDAWVYLLCLALGGRVVFDQNSYIYYRQHDNNVTGARQGIKKRFRTEYNNCFVYKHWREKLIKIILENEHYTKYIPKENKKILEQVMNYRNSWRNTFSLLASKDIRCEIKIIDLMAKAQILIRHF